MGTEESRLKDIRNLHNIELGRLKSTEHLRTLLPLEGDLCIQPKLDGQRYTLQFGPAGVFMVSRSRHGKTKGVGVSSKEPFINVKIPPDMKAVLELASATLGTDVVIDGEFVTLGPSTASEVSKIDTAKKFVAFDILWFDGDDVRVLSLFNRLEMLEEVVKAIGSPLIELVPCTKITEYTDVSLAMSFDMIREYGVEGFVLKSNGVYSKNSYGWKIKLKDTCDAVVTGWNEERKHSLGKVTRTGRVGSVQVSWLTPDGEYKGVAWVALPEADRCPLTDASYNLSSRVVEFSHLGWDGKLFRFPQFIRWRDYDKSAIDCTWDDSKTKIKIETEVSDC